MTITITITVAITITMTMMMMMMTMTMTMTMTMMMMMMMMMMMIDLTYGVEGGIGGYIYLGILQLDQRKGKVTAEYIGREIKTVM